MPNRKSCDIAIRVPAANLLIPDPDLREGSVEKINIKNRVGKQEVPYGFSGGFAVVYKFRARSGQLRALRCFMTSMPPDTRERYELLGVYLAKHAPTITAEVRYHARGIRMQEIGETTSKEYPLIEMEWIEGSTLIDYVQKLCEQKNRAGLNTLLEQWQRLILILKKANIAHGDLSGSNIMVRTNGQLVLVDYDSIYLPELAGRTTVVAGQVDYQHPCMDDRQFNESMDDFSALVILSALIALSDDPLLWDQFNELGDLHLLFRQEDFLDPDHSLLFQQLSNSTNTRLLTAITTLKEACRLPLVDVRLPLTLFDPDFEKKKSLLQLESAIQNNTDDAIVQAWIPSLQNYQPAEHHLPRVEQARKNIQAKQQFHKAFQSQNPQLITQAYDSFPHLQTTITGSQQTQLDLARTFLQAYRDNNTLILADIWTKLQTIPLPLQLQLTPQEQQRLQQAYQQQAKTIQWSSLEQALTTSNHEQVIRLAREIEHNYRVPMHDLRVELCKIKFLLGFKPQNVFAHLESNLVTLKWDWPANDLIDNAIIIWQGNQRPQHPRHASNVLLQHRLSNQTSGKAQFPVPWLQKLYLNIYFVIASHAHNRHIWLYSFRNETILIH